MLFSATMPRRLDSLARRHLRDPVRITIGREKAEPGEAPRVRQTAYVVPRAAKPAALGRILDVEAPTAAIVFCRTREEVDTLTETLNGRGYRAEALHGGMSQEQRDRVMGRLRGGTADLLVATDVAARGLDIEQLTHVVNYDVPSAPESYVHRIGRVGRAGREGVAITLAEPREHRMLKTIERVAGAPISIQTGADRRRPARPPARPDPRGAAGEPARRRPRPLPRRRRDAHRRVRPHGGRPRRGEAGPRGRRSGRRRRGDPAGRLPAGQGRRPRTRGPRRPVAPTAPARRSSGGPAARLFVGAGRDAGIRPGDLVGAITGETGLKGRDIGSIEIHQRFALVEVPESAADEVVQALRATMIKGRKATVRRDRT